MKSGEVRIVGPDEAMEYFPKGLMFRETRYDAVPDGPLYLACDGVLGVFHGAFWPGVFMIHASARKEAWGRTTDPMRRIVAEFCRIASPLRILAWIPRRNRLAIRLAERCGFVPIAEFPAGEDIIVEMGV